MEISDNMHEILKENGYMFPRVIEGRGICAISRFAFTTAIVFNIDEYSYSGRWCFHGLHEAVEAYVNWEGEGDPSGEWIKYKGEGGERSNVALNQEVYD